MSSDPEQEHRTRAPSPFSNINITSMRCLKCKAPFVPEGDGMLRDSFVSGCSCRDGFEFIYEYNP